MSIYAVARGRVVGPPSRVTAEAGESTALVLESALAGDPGVEYEIVCGDPELGRRVLDQVRIGDHLVVLGDLRLSAVSGPVEDDLCAARVTLVAEAVAVDVGSK